MAAETEPPRAAGPKERVNKVPRWLVVLAALALAGAAAVIVFGYLAEPGWVGAADKKFWDYLELLVVPAALALGLWWLNRMQERERQAQEDRRVREREAEAEQRERERVATEVARTEREREAQAAQRERELEVENQRAQDAALQAYLDQMSQLLTDKDRPLHRSQVGDSLSTVARARTLTVLPRLDGDRKARVVQFLYEAGLITMGRPILNLSEADLNRVCLIGAHLLDANLSGANLSSANLNTNWRALYSEADLSMANLRDASLSKADLGKVNLSDADLSDAKEATNEQLVNDVKSLAGATMLNGQKYEDWLKSKN